VLLFAQSGFDSQGSIRERSRSQKFHQGRFVASPCLCAGSVFSMSSVTEKSSITNDPSQQRSR
jgi:hypothetical protein